MSEHGDLDRDEDESNVRLSRERRSSPNEDSGSGGSHRSSEKRHKKSGAKDMSTIGKKVAEKSGGLFSPEDWMCKSCGNINWARRSTCNMCNMPKFQKAEARTGAGGGYNERDNVEYNERRDESDGEFDEFGRRKKKFRHPTKDQDGSSGDKERSTTKPKSRSLAEDEDDEEDEDEDEDDEFDATKYALDTDDEADDKNHRQASSSSSDKKPSGSHGRGDSRSRSSSSSSDNKKSNRNNKQSNSPRSSKRTDDYYERRQSRSRSPVNTSSRNQQKNNRH